MRISKLTSPLCILLTFSACGTLRRPSISPLGSSPSISGLSPKSWDGSIATGEASRATYVASTGGMVAADDREAAEWGALILRQGGNAVDAAVATAFALAVTRPHLASLGGGGFLLFCPAPKNGPKNCQVIDYREKAPAAAQRDMYVKNGKPSPNLAQVGPLASGVPGVTAGLLAALEKFGTMPRQKLLVRPIELARKGVRFSTVMERAASSRWKDFDPEARRLLGCGQTLNPCTPGAILKQPELAKVLETISLKGRDGFYEGWVARKIAAGFQQSGGILTMADLSRYEPSYREPLRGSFGGFEVVTMPPPSSGGIALLQMLTFTERAREQGQLNEGFASIPAIHAAAHSMMLAFGDRTTYLGDPDFVKVPVTQLLATPYLEARWKTFDPERASAPPPGRILRSGDSAYEHLHTTHFSVIDRHGNAVALTTTINDLFGSGYSPRGTGIIMNNEMDDFSISPGTPNLFGLTGAEYNAIAPGKKPLSSMTPTIIRDASGENRIIIGAQGGPRIITSVYQSLVNRLVYGMSLPDAVAAPRIHEQWSPQTLRMERFGFASETRKGLTALGYSIEDAGHLGIVHAIEHFGNGRSWGAPDPRGEGTTVAE